MAGESLSRRPGDATHSTATTSMNAMALMTAQRIQPPTGPGSEPVGRREQPAGTMDRLKGHLVIEGVGRKTDMDVESST